MYIHIHTGTSPNLTCGIEEEQSARVTKLRGNKSTFL